MEAIRQFVDAEKLGTVIPLPEAMRGSRLEVIIFPAEEGPSQRPETVESIVDSLVGIIPDTGLTWEDYREERLKKYETAD